MTSHTEASTRIFGIVASEARTAVLFRRGPSKRVRLLLWNLATETITPGQWLAGRIYEERCGVSPDGKLLVYFAGKFKSKIATFTALSRPPYFTALLLWPDGMTWGGGGFFENNRRLILNYGRVLEELDGHEAVPDDFEISHVTEYRSRHGAQTPTADQGWTHVSKGEDAPATPEMRVVFSPPWVSTKPNRVHTRLRLERSWLGMFEVNGPSHVTQYRIVETPKPGKPGPAAALELGRVDWADWDHDGSLVYSEGGRLFRRRPSSPLASDTSSDVLVADLRDQTFSNVRPTDEARQWPR